MNKSLLTIIGVLFIVIVCNQSFAQVVFSEGFEGEQFPPEGWTHRRVQGNADWERTSGGYAGPPTGSAEGDYNARLFFSPNNSTELITPPVDISGLTEPILSFWHAQANWGGDQDQLKVYYSDALDGDWTLLAEYDQDIREWTEREFELPVDLNTVYIRFHAFAGWGHGVVLDNIVIHQPMLQELNESFEDELFPPAGWTHRRISGNADWERTSGGFNGPPTGSADGEYNARLFFSPNVSTELITPVVELTHFANPVLSFWHAQANWGGDQDQLKVYYSDRLDGEWTLLVEYDQDIREWTERVFDLPTELETVCIRFLGIAGWGHGVVLDAVVIREGADPSNLIASNVTETTADLGWDENANAEVWDIELGYQGFDPTGIPTHEGVTNNPYTLTCLLTDTAYGFYVRSNLGEGMYTYWAGPATFTTLFRLDSPQIGIEFITDGDENFVKVNWGPVIGAGSYNVYAATVPYSDIQQWDFLATVEEPVNGVFEFIEEIVGNRKFYTVTSIEQEEIVEPPAMILVEGGDLYGNALSSYYYGKYTITQEEYAIVMTGSPNPRGPYPSWFGNRPNHPVENVNWFDAVEYCNRLSIQQGLTPVYGYMDLERTDPDEWYEVFPGWNEARETLNNVVWNREANGYRLPTLHEFRFGARGGLPAQQAGTFDDRYAGTNLEAELSSYAHYGYGGGTHFPVGQLLPNELGLYDMGGNVQEFNWDFPSGAGDEYRLKLSGNFHDHEGYCHIDNTFYYLYGWMRFFERGFRIARNVSE